jgi:hypothetical protein
MKQRVVQTSETGKKDNGKKNYQRLKDFDKIFTDIQQ